MRAMAGLYLAAGLAAAGCGESPTAPQDTPALRIVADPVVTLTVEAPVPLRIEERGSDGRLGEQPAANYTWTSSDPGLVTVAGGVLRASAGYGQATVTARSVSGAEAQTLVWVQLPESVPSTFVITLDYADDVPAWWRQELAVAAARWQRVIRAPLPAVPMPPVDRNCNGGDTPPPPMTGVESGTRIFVSVGTFSESDPAEAIAASCLFRPLPSPTTLFGRIILNRRKLAGGTREDYVALHEMGHVLGLAGNSARQMPWFDSAGRHRGAFAREGARRISGIPVSFLAVSNGHWHDVYDVMMRFGQNTHVSAVSVGALMDLGYAAAWYGAEK
jgi:hypothetical protein